MAMNSTQAQRIFLSSSLSVFLVGCGAPNYSQSEMHMTFEEAETTKQVKPEKIPALVKASRAAPALSDSEDSSTFDVVVSNVPARDLLFALARDAGVNMDIDDEVGGYVSISALDQTLDAILARIAEQISIRVKRVGDAIVVKPDKHYYKHYQIDYLNISRNYRSTASTSGVGGTGEVTISSGVGSDFWSGITASLSQILGSSEYEAAGSAAAVTQEGRGDALAEDIEEAEFRDSGTENTFSLSAETGVLVVYAPDRLQKEVQKFLDRSLAIAKRQVLLEATIVEVVLNNQYAQGIDWSLFNLLAEEGLALYQGSGTAGGAAAALEFITGEIEATFADRGFSGRTYGSLDSAADVASFEGNLDSATRNRINQLFTSFPDPTLPANASTDQIAAHAAALAAARATRGNAIAAALRDSYVSRSLASASSNPQNRLIESTANLESSDPDDNNYVTYTGGLEYTVQELNEQATRASSGGLLPNSPLDESFFTAAYRSGDISAAVQLLDKFGDARVLSSPRISALNHQPALLRVVDQEVYFTFTVEEDINEDTGQASSREYTAEENIVDIGFSMNVLPHISENGEVILNLKPAVTRILDYRRAPVQESFGAAGGGTQNLVPITRVRELESVISLRDGEIAVLGGLLEDRTGDNNTSVPGLSSLPGVGALFEQKSESTYKTEFVVFIRAKVIDNPSINGDYSNYRHLLPNGDFILRDTGDTLLPPAQLQTR